MGYNKIRKMDISDGPGVRVSIFMQGVVHLTVKTVSIQKHMILKVEKNLQMKQ